MRSSSLFMLFSGLVKLTYGATQDCANLGVFDPELNKCVCDPGYTGDNCSKFKFIPKNESIAAYDQGAIDFTTGHTSWGGNVVQGYDKYYMAAETFYNKAGLSCFFGASTCAFWESDTPYGPWKVVGFIGFGDFPGYNPFNVGWCHGIRFTIERRLTDNGKETFALAAYATLKFQYSSKRYQNANLAQPNKSFCSGYVARYDVTDSNQELFVAYKELNATTPVEIRKEMQNILRSGTFVKNINGYDASANVITALRWYSLVKNDKGFKFPIQAVNPQPLVSNQNNYGAWVKDKNGKDNRVLFYRITQKIPGKTKEIEMLDIVYTPVNTFIWEPNAKYSAGPNVQVGHHIEDPFCYTTDKAFVCVVHDNSILGCGRNALGQDNRASCGSTLTFPIPNDPAQNILYNNQNWSYYKRTYIDKIADLDDTTAWRQRATLFFAYQGPDQGQPLVLYTGTIWPGSTFNTKTNKWQPAKHGGSRAYPVIIAY